MMSKKKDNKCRRQKGLQRTGYSQRNWPAQQATQSVLVVIITSIMRVCQMLYPPFLCSSSWSIDYLYVSLLGHHYTLQNGGFTTTHCSFCVTVLNCLNSISFLQTKHVNLVIDNGSKRSMVNSKISIKQQHLFYGMKISFQRKINIFRLVSVIKKNRTPCLTSHKSHEKI